MKSFNQLISEGLYDPGIFKAFFLAGGPGSVNLLWQEIHLQVQV